MDANNKKFNIVQKIKENKKFQYGIIAVLLILALVILFFGSNSKSASSKENTDLVGEYVSNLEQNLSTTLSKIEGVGEVDVVITVKSGMETVLAMETVVKETINGTETIETPILVNGKTVVLKELYPQITGVLIVAKGANNISVIKRIQNATMSLFDVNINQIEILTMK